MKEVGVKNEYGNEDLWAEPLAHLGMVSNPIRMDSGWQRTGTGLGRCLSEPRGSGERVDTWITAGLMICEGPEEIPFRRWWGERLEERGLHWLCF